MTEFGVIAAKGAQNVERLKDQLDRLPEAARMPVDLLFDQLAETDRRIERLTAEIEEVHSQCEISQRLATIPGVGMLSATVIAATTPDVVNFDCARDYAAWLGLRRALYQAATVMMNRGGSTWLRTWAAQIARRRGRKRAMVALARRIGVILHRIWVDGTTFQIEAPVIPQEV